MSLTFKELLDDGWTVAGFGAIGESHYPRIKDRIQRYHTKKEIVRCHRDPETGSFMIAHRTKNLVDYFKENQK